MKRKDNLTNVLILIVSLFLICFSFYLWFSRPLEVRVLDVGFIVGNKMGFDLNSSSLTFGIVLPGSAGVKTVLIENNYDFPVKLRVLVSKELGDFIFSDSEIIILSKGVVPVDFTLILPAEIALGNYSGKLMFEFRKV